MTEALAGDAEAERLLRLALQPGPSGRMRKALRDRQIGLLARLVAVALPDVSPHYCAVLIVAACRKIEVGHQVDHWPFTDLGGSRPEFEQRVRDLLAAIEPNRHGRKSPSHRTVYDLLLPTGRNRRLFSPTVAEQGEPPFEA